MRSQYNDCTFVGNIGKDPEVRDRVTTFSLAVWQGKDKPTLWLHCKSFEAPVLASKGQKVRVTGRLYFETYTDKGGVARSVWGVIVDEVEPLERVEREEKPQQRPAYTPPSDDEEIPF